MSAGGGIVASAKRTACHGCISIRTRKVGVATKLVIAPAGSVGHTLMADNDHITGGSDSDRPNERSECC